jgi:hypothetical protein
VIGRREEGDVPPVFHRSGVNVLGLAFEYIITGYSFLSVSEGLTLFKFLPNAVRVPGGLTLFRPGGLSSRKPYQK